MKHIINGCPVNLRTLTEVELKALIDSTEARLQRVTEELESVCGESVRRREGTDIQFALKFDLPPHHNYDGRSA